MTPLNIKREDQSPIKTPGKLILKNEYGIEDRKDEYAGILKVNNIERVNGLDDLENFDPNVKGAVKNGVEHEDNILSGRRVRFAPNVFIRTFTPDRPTAQAQAEAQAPGKIIVPVRYPKPLPEILDLEEDGESKGNSMEAKEEFQDSPISRSREDSNLIDNLLHVISLLREELENSRQTHEMGLMDLSHEINDLNQEINELKKRLKDIFEMSKPVGNIGI